MDIHFIHVRSRHKNALPMIVSHGWPGSVFEQLKIIGPLTNPTAHGGSAEDVFDVVIPSLPGYGFSGRPSETGWGPERIARAWAELMRRLGYTRYVAQGGDWGSPVSKRWRGRRRGLLGIHINLPATVPPEVAAVLPAGGPAPAGLSEKERAVFESLVTYARRETRPTSDDDRTAANHRLRRDGLACRSRGVAARASGVREMEIRRRSRADADEGRSAGQHHSVLADEHRRLRSAHVLGEHGRGLTSAADQKTDKISLPVAITVFPEEVYRSPETWARRAYPNLIYFNEADKGGHFAAWEQPKSSRRTPRVQSLDAAKASALRASPAWQSCTLKQSN